MSGAIDNNTTPSSTGNMLTNALSNVFNTAHAAVSNVVIGAKSEASSMKEKLVKEKEPTELASKPMPLTGGKGRKKEKKGRKTRKTRKTRKMRKSKKNKKMSKSRKTKKRTTKKSRK